MPKSITTNWQTTLAGLGTIFVAVGGVLIAQFDGNDQTVVNWNVAVTAIIAGIGLILGRDGNK